MSEGLSLGNYIFDSLAFESKIRCHAHSSPIGFCVKVRHCRGTFGAIIGEIVDAEDRVVFHVDVSYSREKAGQISAAILTAVNTCGGFKVS